MSRVIRHQLDIFGTVLRLAYDEKTWRALVEDHPGAPSNMDPDHPPVRYSGMTYALTWEPRARKRQLGTTVQHVSIWIHAAPLERDQSELVATVAHECVHAAADIYEKAAAKETPVQAGEPFAYLVEWLTRWVWDNLP